MHIQHTLRILALLFTTGSLLVPVSALAATSAAKPACVMASTTVNSQNVILWVSANATSVTDESGSSTTISGYRFVSPTKTTTYDYAFKGAGGTIHCDTTVSVAVTSTTSYTSSSTKNMTNSESKRRNSNKVSSSSTAGTVSLSMLPLLTGGKATLGGSVPVAYIQVSNKGTATSSIDGFTLSQVGTASDAAVIGFATSDNKGGSRATIGGTEGSGVVKNGSAFVPLKADIAPGQLRIFTIKATLSRTALQVGKTVRFDVASVSTKASVQGSLPLAGVVWTL